ncbi:hypothetical protein V1286_001151 [Bradyrhizobium algeriense]|uniref:ATP-dependent DNA ligase family profile domain-containing protein n=1 Tax=Bradyrhizobium algeriense TaxID=634784 RepID=A0ABU8B507_9BRAD
MLDLTERLVAQSIHAISRRASTPADSFEAWSFLDEPATAAAALPHTREAYPSFRLRLYDTDHKGTESASAGTPNVYIRRATTGPTVSRRLPPTPGTSTRLRDLDGEIVVHAADGTTDSSVLQNELMARTRKIVLVAFDLLYLNGYDLRKVPLFESRRC